MHCIKDLLLCFPYLISLVSLCVNAQENVRHIMQACSKEIFRQSLYKINNCESIEIVSCVICQEKFIIFHKILILKQLVSTLHVSCDKTYNSFTY